MWEIVLILPVSFLNSKTKAKDICLFLGEIPNPSGKPLLAVPLRLAAQAEVSAEQWRTKQCEHKSSNPYSLIKNSLSGCQIPDLGTGVEGWGVAWMGGLHSIS